MLLELLIERRYHKPGRAEGLVVPRSSSRLLAPLILAALLLASCQSPEATRARGERGADVGNRSATVDLHGKPDPFRGTPKLESPR